jgi:hypothetical protein
MYYMLAPSWSETVTPPVEHSTSCALEGTTELSAGCGKIASLLNKTVVQINAWWGWGRMLS